VVAWVRRSRSGTDVSATALSVLDRLELHGAQRVTDLAALEGISQPATTSLVNRLEERGWARREADPADGRAARVVLTDAGHDRLLQHRTERSRRIAQRLATLDEADQAALIAALPALVHLTATSGASARGDDRPDAGGGDEEGGRPPALHTHLQSSGPPGLTSDGPNGRLMRLRAGWRGGAPGVVMRALEMRAAR